MEFELPRVTLHPVCNAASDITDCYQSLMVLALHYYQK